MMTHDELDHWEHSNQMTTLDYEMIKDIRRLKDIGHRDGADYVAGLIDRAFDKNDIETMIKVLQDGIKQNQHSTTKETA